MDMRNLENLTLYQKECVMLGAICQGMESWWSVNATRESRLISRKAVAMIIDYCDAYLEGDEKSTEKIHTALEFAEQAIRMTQTSAVYAMSCRLSVLYKIPQERAAFVCLPYVWEYMIENIGDNTELAKVFEHIACALNCENAQEGKEYLKAIHRELFGQEKVTVNPADIPLLVKSVNAEQLKNNPVKLDENTLTKLYTNILEELQYSTGKKSIGQKIISFLGKCFAGYVPSPEAVIYRDRV
ncbi:MAG: iron-containing alcohol dehydrogenase [Roseburia sp.]|nr:iron-containing alcohol dehydrogenase [Roseburia sp.]